MLVNILCCHIVSHSLHRLKFLLELGKNAIVDLFKDQILKGEIWSKNDEKYYNKYFYYKNCEVKQELCKSSVNSP